MQDDFAGLGAQQRVGERAGKELGVRVAYMFVSWKAGRPDLRAPRVSQPRGLLLDA